MVYSDVLNGNLFDDVVRPRAANRPNLLGISHQKLRWSVYMLPLLTALTILSGRYAVVCLATSLHSTLGLANYEEPPVLVTGLLQFSTRHVR